ncbi:TetR/AcrR family transcriptional regulator [Olivibacter ginsenosidimutans]
MKAAIHLIAQKGFAATSIREIAMMASVNLSMINYYFSSKNRLLDSILQEGIQKIMEKIQSILTGRQAELEKMFAMIDIHITYAFHQHEMAKIFFQEELVKNSPAVQELRQINYKSFEEIIHTGQLNGAFSDNINPALFYSTIVGTIQQFMVKQLSPDMTADKYTYAKRLSKQAEELND